jgi:hypothetical protein
VSKGSVEGVWLDMFGKVELGEGSESRVWEKVKDRDAKGRII